MSYADPVYEDRIIWEGQPYAAFTSLVHYDDYFYCAFREAMYHSDLTGNDCGVIRIIRSSDGKLWELYHTFSKPGYDLRDPQLCVTPDTLLMVIAEAVLYNGRKAVKRNSVVAFDEKEGGMSDFMEVVFTPELNRNWLWQPKSVNGKICGFLYRPYFAFAVSDDGIKFHVGPQKCDSNISTEASVSFYNECYYALVRTSDNAELGISIDGESWEWFPMGEKIACPNLFEYDGRLLCAGRLYNEKEQQVSLFEIDTKKKDIKLILNISSGRDCAYPGV
ncbi:MAG: hypothetical protein ACI3Y2_05430, partial [Candidatus Egerieousia sp.]